jgi:hypothetical protein
VKVPESGKIEAILIIGAALLAGYAAWRVYSVGSKAALAVSDTIGAGIDAIQNGVNKAYTTVIPAEMRVPDLSELPSGDDYPENFGGVIYGGSRHATPAEVDAYFGKSSPDAMGN